KVTGRQRSLTDNAEANGWADDAHLVNGDQALIDLEVDGELIERRPAAAEVAAAGERTALEAPQQLLDIDPGQRAGAGIERGGAIEPVGNRQDRISGPLEIDRQGAVAFDLVQTEYLT